MQYRRYDFWKWGAFLSIVLLPGIAVVLCTYHAFPASGNINALLMAITVLCIFMLLKKSNEPDRVIRHVGIGFDLGATLVIVFGLFFHAQLARELSSAEEAQIEIKEKSDRLQADLEAAKGRKLALDESERSLAQSRAREAEAEANRYYQQWRLGGSVGSRSKGTKSAAGGSAGPSLADVEISSLARRLEEMAKIDPSDDPKEIRKKWYGRIFYTSVIEVFLAVFGVGLVSAMRSWDSNQNGIPDWIERAAYSMPQEEFVRHFPFWSRALLPDNVKDVKPENGKMLGTLGFAPNVKTNVAPKRADLGPGPTLAGLGATLVPKKRVYIDPKFLDPLWRFLVPSWCRSGAVSDKQGVNMLTPETAKNGVLRKGNTWLVLGRTMPNINFIRWKPDWSRHRIQAMAEPESGGRQIYLGSFSKRRLDELDSEPEAVRFEVIRSQIRDWQRKKGIES